VKSGDLVVIHIRGDKCLWRKFTLQMTDVAGGYTQRFKPSHVRAEIVTNGGHRIRVATQHFQVIGYIACNSAKLTTHFRNQERYIQHMYFLREDMIFKPLREYHDGVIRQGTTD